eukprot:scaffold10690_cov39-Phaeocystis_antarctica.AAC.1
MACASPSAWMLKGARAAGVLVAGPRPGSAELPRAARRAPRRRRGRARGGIALLQGHSYRGGIAGFDHAAPPCRPSPPLPAASGASPPP